MIDNLFEMFKKLIDVPDDELQDDNSIVLAAVSCFEEDQPVPPYELPANVDTLSIQNSIYDYQVYFDFSSGSIVSENEKL